MNINDIYLGVIGGFLIGLSAVGLMFTLGRISGVSGIIKSSIWSNDKTWRIVFIIGLLLTTSLFHSYYPEHVVKRENFPLILLGLSGILVGLGVTLGNGCTSGHGICGISRFSIRSIVASLVFFLVALFTRFMFHSVLEITP